MYQDRQTVADACRADSKGKPGAGLAFARCVSETEDRIFSYLPVADLVAIRSAKRLELARQVESRQMTADQATSALSALNRELKAKAISRQPGIQRTQAIPGAADAPPYADLVEQTFR